MNWWIGRLAQVAEKYENLARMLGDPEVISDTNKLRIYSKEHSNLTPVIEAYREYVSLKDQLEEAEEMIQEEKKTLNW